MMNAREVNIKERISLTSHEYSVLKKNMKDDECRWCNMLKLLRVGIKQT
jgi:hypothetical protein